MGRVKIRGVFRVAPYPRLTETAGRFRGWRRDAVGLFAEGHAGRHRHCPTGRPGRGPVHPPHDLSWAARRVHLGAGGGERGCGVRHHCRVWPDRRFRLAARLSGLAAAGRRLLSGHWGGPRFWFSAYGSALCCGGRGWPLAPGGSGCRLAGSIWSGSTAARAGYWCSAGSRCSAACWSSISAKTPPITRFDRGLSAARLHRNPHRKAR